MSRWRFSPASSCRSTFTITHFSTEWNPSVAINVGPVVTGRGYKALSYATASWFLKNSLTGLITGTGNKRWGSAQNDDELSHLCRRSQRQAGKHWPFATHSTTSSLRYSSRRVRFAHLWMTVTPNQRRRHCCGPKINTSSFRPVSDQAAAVITRSRTLEHTCNVQ